MRCADDTLIGRLKLLASSYQSRNVSSQSSDSGASHNKQLSAHDAHEVRSSSVQSSFRHFRCDDRGLSELIFDET